MFLLSFGLPLRAPTQATLTVSDVLQLLPLVYSLAPDAAAASGAEPGSSGPLSPGEEEELKAAVATAVEVDLQEQVGCCCLVDEGGQGVSGAAQGGVGLGT